MNSPASIIAAGPVAIASSARMAGKAPLVRIDRPSRETAARPTKLAALGFVNPCVQVRSHIAVDLIDSLEAEGKLRRGGTIVEPNSGKTGIAIAFVAVARGYRFILTMPDGFPVGRQRMLRLLGVELVPTPKEEGMTAAIEKAQEIAARTPGAVILWHQGTPAPDGADTAAEIGGDRVGEVAVQ